MPAVSRNQRIAMSIAEHHPDKLYDRNKGLLAMTKPQFDDFAATKESGLPQAAGLRKGLKRLKP